MNKREVIEEVLDILRNTPLEETIDVCCNLDVDYILSKWRKSDGVSCNNSDNN